MCRSEEFSTVTNKQVDRAVRSLLVFCTNNRKGCEWQGEVNGIPNHFRNSNGCQFDSCLNDCGKSIQWQFLTSHVEDECVHSKVICEYCLITGEQHFVGGQHTNQCPKFPTLCPNKCGTVPRCDVTKHKKVCPLEMVQCEYHVVGCDARMARQNQWNHNKENVEEHLFFVMSELTKTKKTLTASLKNAKQTILDELTEKVHQVEKDYKVELTVTNDRVVEIKTKLSIGLKQAEDNFARR